MKWSATDHIRDLDLPSAAVPWLPGLPGFRFEVDRRSTSPKSAPKVIRNAAPAIGW